METTTEPATVLIVDDNPDNISILVAALKDTYLTKAATSGMQALEISRAAAVDLILLDIMMPDMDGYETCRRLKADDTTRDIPVIFVTALRESKDESEGFACGAVDFISKPVNESLLHARVKTHVELHRARCELMEWNSNLKRKAIHNAGMLREKSQIMSELRRDSESIPMLILSRVLAIQSNSYFTHATNVTALVSDAARQLSLGKTIIRDLNLAALLHDVGKLHLNKSFESVHSFDLNDTMLREINLHPVRGQEILADIEPLLDSGLMIRHHHELLDGSGYPDGLKGEDIPIGAQLIGIADFIDHAVRDVSQNRTEYAFSKLASHAGFHFNPELFQSFRNMTQTLYDIDPDDR